MITRRGVRAKRLIKKGLACRVHKGYRTMYRAINKSIHDDGDEGLNPGSCTLPKLSFPPPPRRVTGPRTIATPRLPGWLLRDQDGIRMINRWSVSSAYPQPGYAQYLTREMGAQEHHVPTPRYLRITFRAPNGGRTA